MSHELPNNCKIILQQNIPIEDLLGSVTTYNNVEGSDSKSLQLRTSARVFKKMKLDSANAASTLTSSTSEKKAPDPSPALKEDIKQEPSTTKKPYRPLWNHEDKTLFFEALSEFGKDFEAIYSYFSNKSKKRGVPESMIKTKEQMRHLYYRTWHKISKHLKFSDEVKKLAQELYGLINYGELRKKMSMISERTCMKLNELIYRGVVTIRVKGKTIRIKTPMCKALRKLNQLGEKENDLKLPARVTVELIPRDMHTWMHVQNISQNPRVRTMLPLQKRLSSLLMCMTDRWNTQCAAQSQKMLQLFKDGINGDVQLLREIEENKMITDPPLRFSPPGISNIVLPTLNLSEYLSSQSICLNAYEERFGVKTPGEQIWLNCCKGSSKRGGAKRPRQESNSEKISLANKSLATTDNNENCVNDNDLPPSVSEVIDEAVNTLLALQQQQQLLLPQQTDSTGSSDEKQEIAEVKLEVIEDLDKKQNDIARIRKGWTLADCGLLSIGDLYLMFGSDSKLLLEYAWDEEFIKKENEYPEKGNKENIETLDDEAINPEYKDSLIRNPNDLSVTLKRLLSVAKLHYRKNRIECPCGHVCGESSKQNSNKNKTVTKNLMITTPKDKFYNNQEKPVSVQQQGEVLMIQSLNANTHIRRLSPSILFRRPSSPNDILKAQLDSIQRLKPRYCNRRGRRPRNKPVVVERKLPILANKAENGRQFVQMSIISQDNIASTTRNDPQRPVVSKTHFDNGLQDQVGANQLNLVYINETTTPGDVRAMGSANIAYSSDVITEGKANQVNVGYARGVSTIENESGYTNQILANKRNAMDITDNATTPSRVGSPTSISNLLQMALVQHGVGEIMQTSAVKEDGTVNFVGLLSQNMSTGNTSPTSPSRILKENENQWLNSEVADFSLSSFLGHLDSPMKAAQTSTGDDNTRLSLTQDVDAHLQSLLNETSLDYTAKFADLAARVTDTKK